MNWRRATEKLVTWWWWVMKWWYGVAFGAAAFAFLTPLLSTPAKEDPTGGAGQFAPLVAICVAAMLLAEAVNTRGLQIRKCRASSLLLAAWPALTYGWQMQVKPTRVNQYCWAH